MKFKIGDRVRYIKNDGYRNLPDNHTGTIKYVLGVESIGVEWDEPWDRGHYSKIYLLNGKITGNRGLWVRERDIELIQPPVLGKLIISLPTQEEWDKVMRVLEDMGVRWCAGQIATNYNAWNYWKEETAIRINRDIIYGKLSGFLEEDKFYCLHTFITAQEFLEKYGRKKSASIEAKKINTPSEKPEGIKNLKKLMSKKCVDSITINGVEYAPKEDNAPAKQLDGLDYVIVRTDSAGVFAGYLASREGKEAVLYKARRLWYWDGASSLSQLAMEGVKKPENCKFPCEVDEIVLTEAIEVIPCRERARKSIEEVKVWEQ